MNGVLQIEMRRHRGKIVRIVIEVVAVGHLAGVAVAAPIVGNHAIALLRKNSIWLSQSSADSSQPRLNTMG